MNSEQGRVERRKIYRPFEAKRPRKRNVCPKCGSLNVRRRRSTMNYTCGRCGWVGESVGIEEC